MLSTYLKVAGRRIVNNKLYAAINVLGLAFGLACCLLILMFLAHELTYDRFHPNAERIHRVSWNFSGEDGAHLATNKAFVGTALAEEFAEVEQYTRISHGGELLLSHGDVAFNEDGLYLADNSIFELFDIKWLQGDPGQALITPSSIVITESFARRYFAGEDAMGQSLLVENALPLTVTGIVQDLPDNTHLRGEAFASLTTGTILDPEFLTGGGRFVFHTYIKLAPGVVSSDIESRLPEFLQRRGPDYASRGSLELTPLTEIHLSTPREFQMRASGDPARLLAFSLVALCVLAISCINFMNLSTARSMQRAREVGMRKSIGAARSQIVQQFLAESFLIVIGAMLLALVLLEVVMPTFNAFTGVPLSLDVLTRPLALASLAGLVVLVGLVAGSYPAFYLSAFKPAKVLKGELTQGNAAQAFRNLLVIGQFAMAIVLIVATAVIYLQTNFARNLDPGFDRDRVVILEGTPFAALGPQWETLKQRLLSHPQISAVTASRDIPGSQQDYSYDFWYEGRAEDGLSMLIKIVDYDYFETYGINVLAGRTFDAAFPTDRFQSGTDGSGSSAAYILNASAARLIGWTPDQAVDNWLEIGFGAVKGDVIAVVEDVHDESIRNSIEPLVYILGHTQANPGDFSDDFIYSNASIKVTGDDLRSTLDFIDSTWADFMPAHPAIRYFLDQRFEAMYQAEMNLGRLLGYFSVLAVIIACMGLFGLATFNAERRTKEIGVRKVMGGSVWSIVLLLTNDFSRLVLVSNVIAWPVAYFAMERWLENFAYRIDLTPLVFIASGLIALCIAWVTVGGTAAKAASQKPVLALRYE